MIDDMQSTVLNSIVFFIKEMTKQFGCSEH